MRGRMGMAVLALLAGMARPAAAVDTFAVEYGAGDDDAQRFGLAFTWDWNRKWFADGAWYLGGYWEVGGSYWDADPGRTGTDSLGEGGAAAVFRLQPHNPIGAFMPFVEAGLGMHVFSETELQDKDFDINFSFAEHIGAGVRFGDASQWELGYRYQHLSNASIGDSNPGINYHLIRLAFRFGQ